MDEHRLSITCPMKKLPYCHIAISIGEKSPNFETHRYDLSSGLVSSQRWNLLFPQPTPTRIPGLKPFMLRLTFLCNGKRERCDVPASRILGYTGYTLKIHWNSPYYQLLPINRANRSIWNHLNMFVFPRRVSHLSKRRSHHFKAPSFHVHSVASSCRGQRSRPRVWHLSIIGRILFMFA